MADSLEKLISQLSGQAPYTALTEQEIQQQAEERYRSVYAQKRLGTAQAFETQDAALLRQKEGLAVAFDRERAQSAAQTHQTYAAANRQALTRGMQRSSYNNANLVNIRLAGEEALRGITQRQTDAEAAVEEERTQLAGQQAAQMRQYDADEQSDRLAYADTLSAREYDRAWQSRTAENELAMKLYEYQHQLEQEAAEQARWQAEFNARYGEKTSSKSGGSGKSTPKPKPTQGKPTIGGTRPGVPLLK